MAVFNTGKSKLYEAEKQLENGKAELAEGKNLLRKEKLKEKENFKRQRRS